MKNLIIIGAGGMGREIYDLSTQCHGYNKEYVIKGFLDDWNEALNGYDGYPPVIGKVSDYVVKPEDIFVCSFGDVELKKNCIELILDKGGDFLTLIHPTASIGCNTKIGTGCIVLMNAYIGADCIIEDFVLVQIAAVVGHDVKVGKYSRLDCNTLCVGGTEIKEEVRIHTSAVINHRVVVGRKAQVGACSFVIRKVKEGTTVFGNPAKKIKTSL